MWHETVAVTSVSFFYLYFFGDEKSTSVICGFDVFSHFTDHCHMSTFIPVDLFWWTATKHNSEGTSTQTATPDRCVFNVCLRAESCGMFVQQRNIVFTLIRS